MHAAASFIRVIAAKRFTAVGRVAERSRTDASTAARSSPSVEQRGVRTARRTANAAATPMAGAPRIFSDRIASQTTR